MQMAAQTLGALAQGSMVLVTQNQVCVCVCACVHVLSGEAAMTQLHTASVCTCVDVSGCVSTNRVGNGAVTDSTAYGDWAPTGQL